MGFISSLVGAKNNYAANPMDPMAQALLQQSQATGGQQANLATALNAAMNGQGPSLADSTFKKNLGQIVNAGNAQVMNQRGINRGLAAREAAQNMDTIGGNAALDSGMLRAKEQMDARQQMGTVLGQERQGDLGQYDQYGNNLSQAHSTNAQIHAQNAGTNAGIAGGLLNAAGGAGAALMAAGGEVLDWGDRGKKAGDSIASGLTAHLPGKSGGANMGGAQDINNVGGVAGGVAGDLPDISAAAALAAKGGKVPGNAPVAGDSYSNDTVPTMLSPGEVVVPRSITQSSDAPDKAAEFIKALKAEKQKKSGKEMRGYAHVLSSHQNVMDRLGQVEKLCYGAMVR